MNNNSMRFSLLPLCHLHCLCVQSESQRNALLVFKTDLLNNSDNVERFFGFRTENIVLQEAVADSNFDANEVSVHTSYWSN